MNRIAKIATLLGSWLFATQLAQPATVLTPQVLSDCADCGELVVVPVGRFIMGSDTDADNMRPEGPAHAVRIRRAFALGRTEVTVAQFRRFAAATGYQASKGCRVPEKQLGPKGRIEWRDDAESDWQNPGFSKPQSDDEPVVCVGRVDALAYLDWLTSVTGKRYRLPSESEWEYAAHAGTTSAYFWGNNPDNACAYANLYDKTAHSVANFGWSFADCEDGFAEAAPVGHFKPNTFGLHDMIGNVWEWTADCYHEYYDAQVPTDGSAVPGSADCKNWSIRGGGWMTRPGRQRITFRGRDPNNAHDNYFGFRVARDLVRGK